MRSPFPEMSKCHQVLIFGATFCPQNKIERLDSGVDLLGRECPECLHHAQAQIIVQRQPAPALGWKSFEDRVEQMIVPVSNVNPLRKQQQDLGRMSLTRKQPGPNFFAFIENDRTLGHAAQIKGAIQVFDDLRSDGHIQPDSLRQSNSVDVRQKEGTPEERSRSARRRET
jgi:hypothetical protein